MLLIDAAVGSSAIHGLGLIANQFVREGSNIWVYESSFDIELTEQQIRDLSPAALGQALKYSYLHPETRTYVLCGDDARFTNHSDSPNTRCRDQFMIAIQDIHPGEEITCDYAEFDLIFQERRNFARR